MIRLLNPALAVSPLSRAPLPLVLSAAMTIVPATNTATTPSQVHRRVASSVCDGTRFVRRMNSCHTTPSRGHISSSTEVNAVHIHWQRKSWIIRLTFQESKTTSHATPSLLGLRAELEPFPSVLTTAPSATAATMWQAIASDTVTVSPWAAVIAPTGNARILSSWSYVPHSYVVTVTMLEFPHRPPFVNHRHARDAYSIQV